MTADLTRPADPADPDAAAAVEAERRLLASLATRRSLAESVQSRYGWSVPAATDNPAVIWDAVSYFWWRRVSPFAALLRRRRAAWLAGRDARRAASRIQATNVAYVHSASGWPPVEDTPAAQRRTVWDRIRAVFAPSRRQTAEQTVTDSELGPAPPGMATEAATLSPGSPTSLPGAATAAPAPLASGGAAQSGALPAAVEGRAAPGVATARPVPSSAHAKEAATLSPGSPTSVAEDGASAVGTESSGPIPAEQSARNAPRAVPGQTESASAAGSRPGTGTDEFSMADDGPARAEGLSMALSWPGTRATPLDSIAPLSVSVRQRVEQLLGLGSRGTTSSKRIPAPSRLFWWPGLERVKQSAPHNISTAQAGPPSPTIWPASAGPVARSSPQSAPPSRPATLGQASWSLSPPERLAELANDPAALAATNTTPPRVPAAAPPPVAPPPAGPAAAAAPAIAPVSAPGMATPPLGMPDAGVAALLPPLSPPLGATRVVYEGIYVGRRRPRPGGPSTADASERSDRPTGSGGGTIAPAPGLVGLMPPPAPPLPPPTQPGLLGETQQRHAILRSQARRRQQFLEPIEASREWTAEHVIRGDELRLAAQARARAGGPSADEESWAHTTFTYAADTALTSSRTPTAPLDHTRDSAGDAPRAAKAIVAEWLGRMLRALPGRPGALARPDALAAHARAAPATGPRGTSDASLTPSTGHTPVRTASSQSSSPPTGSLPVRTFALPPTGSTPVSYSTPTDAGASADAGSFEPWPANEPGADLRNADVGVSGLAHHAAAVGGEPASERRTALAQILARLPAPMAAQALAAGVLERATGVRSMGSARHRTLGGAMDAAAGVTPDATDATTAVADVTGGSPYRGLDVSMAAPALVTAEPTGAHPLDAASTPSGAGPNMLAYAPVGMVAYPPPPGEALPTVGGLGAAAAMARPAGGASAAIGAESSEPAASSTLSAAPGTTSGRTAGINSGAAASTTSGTPTATTSGARASTSSGSAAMVHRRLASSDPSAAHGHNANVIQRDIQIQHDSHIQQDSHIQHETLIQRDSHLQHDSLIQRESHLQRVIDDAPSSAQQTSAPDVDALADEVYARLRWRLSAERERTFG